MVVGKLTSRCDQEGKGGLLQMACRLKVTLAPFVGTLEYHLDTLRSSSFISELASSFLFFISPLHFEWGI